MAHDKKPGKNGPRKDAAVTCDRTYVADRCPRAAAAQERRLPHASSSASSSSASSSSVSAPAASTSSASPPGSPAVRVPDVACRHQRKSAVRIKRPVSLSKPRPMDQRSGNAYVETCFADGKQQDARQQKPAEKRRERPANDMPLIDFSAVGEEIMMKPLQPTPHPVDGVDEFPAYAPWKAAAFPAGATGVMVTRRSPMVAAGYVGVGVGVGLGVGDGVGVGVGDGVGVGVGDGVGVGVGDGVSAMCAVCKKCRCTTCQRKCKEPRVRVCSAEVRRNGCVDVAAVCLPCVNKTARCLELPATSRSSSDGKWGLLLCLLCPCLSAYCRRRPPVAPCPDTCYGNVDVTGCKCVDWDALKALNRDRRRRHYCQRRHHRASDATITTTTTTNSTAAADSSSNITTGPSSSFTAATTTDDTNDSTTTVTLVAAHDDSTITVASSTGGIKSNLRPYRNYKNHTD